MKKWFLCFLLCLIGCKDKAQEKNDEILNVGMSVDYAPYEFYENNKIVGFDVDLANEIGKHLKKKIVIKDMAFEGLIAALQSQHIDMVISCFSETPERRKKVDFSKIYYQNINRLVVRQESRIKTIQDLESVGVQAGSTYETNAKDWQKKVQGLRVHALSRIPELVQELKIGRIDALLMGSTEVKRLMESQKDFKAIEIENNADGFAVAFPKNSPLKEKVNQVIDKIKHDGTLQKMQSKWLKE